MRLLLATFGVAVASALFPLINIEAYIAGVGALVANYGILPVSLVAGAGQAVGKVFWYEVGRSSLHWSYVKKKMEAPAWQRRYQRVYQTTQHRPWTGLALLLGSAVTGFPPLAIMAVLAGQLRFHRLWFYGLTFVGRTIRFVIVLGGVAWIRNTGILG